MAILKPAQRKSGGYSFAGHPQGRLVKLIMRAATEAARRAVAENARLGINSPGSRNGRLVLRKPNGTVVTL